MMSTRYLLPSLLFLLVGTCCGQTLMVKISADHDRPQSVQITVKRVRQSAEKDQLNVSWLREYAGISGLADRLSSIRLENSTGQTVAFRQFMPGELLAEADFDDISFDMDLSPMPDRRAAGHTSWIGRDLGLLFFRDVLPAHPRGTTAKVGLQLPSGWTSTLNSGRSVDVDQDVILMGRSIRSFDVSESGVNLHIFTTGEWKFQDADLASFCREITGQYIRELGPLPVTDADIIVIPFPAPAGFDHWEADTRGRTVTIVTSDMPFRTQSVQRLHEQLRHEIFHLWFPNALALTGRYDWFYEGAALYHSLKTGVTLNRLRFVDMLDTLGRAITIDSALPDRRSLAEISAQPIGDRTLLYARGMLAAFLIDIDRLESSRGRDDLTSVLREIVQRHRSGTVPVDGTRAVLEAINSSKLEQFAAGVQVDWLVELKRAGIEVSGGPGTVTLTVARRPTSLQRKLLDKLGYNSWRKLSSTPR